MKEHKSTTITANTDAETYEAYKKFANECGVSMSLLASVILTRNVETLHRRKLEVMDAKSLRHGKTGNQSDEVAELREQVRRLTQQMAEMQQQSSWLK